MPPDSEVVADSMTVCTDDECLEAPGWDRKAVGGAENLIAKIAASSHDAAPEVVRGLQEAQSCNDSPSLHYAGQDIETVWVSPRSSSGQPGGQQTGPLIQHLCPLDSAGPTS